MKPNVKPGTRRPLIATMLILAATLLSLASGACAFHKVEAPAADREFRTLREALSPDDLARVALLDGQAPFPATAGRAALFIDGAFYAQAADPVRSYVLEQLRQGLPVVLFGDQAGYEALRSSIGAAADLPAETDPPGAEEEGASSAWANPAAGARGLKVYPSRRPDGLPSAAAIEVSGSPDNPAPLIEPAIRWAQACAGEAR